MNAWVLTRAALQLHVPVTRVRDFVSMRRPTRPASICRRALDASPTLTSGRRRFSGAPKAREYLVASR